MKPHYPTVKNVSLTSPFGWRTHPINRSRSHHDGIDLAPIPAGKTGVPIYAVAGGTVVQSLYNSVSGNRIYIRHAANTNRYSVYCHLASRSVSVNQQVKRGQIIGYMGTTGGSTGIHLHFGVSNGFPRWSNGSYRGNFVNPSSYLNTHQKVSVDGYMGKNTVRMLQNYFNLYVDGEMWGQYSGNQATQAFNSNTVKFGRGGSAVVRSLQGLAGVGQDGIWGENTTRALQRYFKTPVDGVISRPSSLISEIQRGINAGKL